MLTLSKRLMQISLLFCVAIIILVPSAFADSTYTYQGPVFTAFDGIDKCVLGVGTCAITSSVTLSNPLGDNFNGVVSPTAFSISDGQNVLTNNGFGVSLIEAYFITDSSGKIIDWLVDVSNPSAELFTSVNRFGIGFGNCSGPANDGTTQGLTPSNYGCAQTSFGGPVGVWTSRPTTAAPEPSTVLALGIGLLVLAGLAAKKTIAA